MNRKLMIIFIATSTQLVIAMDLQRNYEYQNGESITLESPIPQELSNKFGQGWWKADLTKKTGEKISLYPLRKTKTGPGIIWNKPIPNMTSQDGAYTILDVVYFDSLFKDPKSGIPTLTDRNYCFFIELKTGCIVTIETGAACAGKWINNNIWSGLDYAIDISKARRPKIESLLANFHDKNKKSNTTQQMGIYFNMKNQLTCDKITLKNIGKYSSLLKHLENTPHEKQILASELANFKKILPQNHYSISTNKSYLFDLPNEISISSNYLIKGDKIQIIDNSQLENGWCKIRYTTKSGKVIEKWIKSSDINLP